MKPKCLETPAMGDRSVTEEEVKRKKERKDDGRIHVKVIIIFKQEQGVSELAAAGI
jgi:hypothetical protein